ncbi:contactin-associated protein like 5-1-like [Sigmodon hispidus]
MEAQVSSPWQGYRRWCLLTPAHLWAGSESVLQGPQSLSDHSVGESDVADFDGRSSLLYRFNQKMMSTLKDVISLKFKSLKGDGVLFHGEGQRGDYITLELQKGRLALYLNLDDSKARLSSISPSAVLGSLLDDQHWHSVLLERVGKQANFTVDTNTQHFRTKGETDVLDIDYECQKVNQGPPAY